MEFNQDEFKKVCEPLIKYLKDNFHPHVKVIVTGNRAELLEGITTCNTIYDKRGKINE